MYSAAMLHYGSKRVLRSNCYNRFDILGKISLNNRINRVSALQFCAQKIDAGKAQQGLSEEEKMFAVEVAAEHSCFTWSFGDVITHGGLRSGNALNRQNPKFAHSIFYEISAEAKMSLFQKMRFTGKAASIILASVKAQRKTSVFNHQDPDVAKSMITFLSVHKALLEMLGTEKSEQVLTKVFENVEKEWQQHMTTFLNESVPDHLKPVVVQIILKKLLLTCFVLFHISCKKKKKKKKRAAEMGVFKINWVQKDVFRHNLTFEVKKCAFRDLAKEMENERLNGCCKLGECLIRGSAAAANMDVNKQGSLATGSPHCAYKLINKTANSKENPQKKLTQNIVETAFENTLL
ncbi:hypothetical protein RFI_05384 [Reticulomyxa filosa]|uniref:Uncharacterized protein n=1 Tax=Reticulomyxa filosa TaxID=46433 RepID=X6P0Y1_RETFI|nr:hypothetical protein RFI_05384 [Reticulomyxa filosa]|eukprot:ETO31739.1 hypothetical protein RFI_05384 [Reticulomyxa filosa]